ncbi:MAG: hypothetical protein KIT84_26495 [Labilithrix sp.]|nr:hypothetical protein [Labilithrix sp.]MCW5814603.1 hypothetical protein [Labilithrix sp.]
MRNVYTEGARIVAALASQWGGAELARRVETSASMIGHISAGRKLPGYDLRERLATWGVRLESWNEAAASHRLDTRELLGEVCVPFAGAGEAPPGPVRGRDALLSVLADFDERIGKAKMVGAPEGIVVALLNGKASAAEKLAMIQCEGEMTFPQLARTEAWGAFMRVLFDVADRHPAAARDLEHALYDLEDPGAGEGA